MTTPSNLQSTGTTERPDTSVTPGPTGGGSSTTTSASRAPSRTSGRLRRVRLSMRRIDPWSVAKIAFAFSVALLIVLVVAVAVLYLVLDVMGVFDSVSTAVRELTSTGGAGASGGLEVAFSFPRIIGGVALLGAINVLIITALATLAALLYNVCADLTGGLEVTLTETG